MEMQGFFRRQVVQGVLALALTAIISVMAILGREVPEQMWAVLLMGWGFYFGASTTANNVSGQVSEATVNALKAVKNGRL